MVDRRGWSSLEACGESPQKRPWLQVADVAAAAVAVFTFARCKESHYEYQLAKEGSRDGREERKPWQRGPRCGRRLREEPNRGSAVSQDGRRRRQRASSASSPWWRRKKEERKKNGHFLQTLSDGPDHRSTAQRTTWKANIYDIRRSDGGTYETDTQQRLVA